MALSSVLLEPKKQFVQVNEELSTALSFPSNVKSLPITLAPDDISRALLTPPTDVPQFWNEILWNSKIPPLPAGIINPSKKDLLHEMITLAGNNVGLSIICARVSPGNSTLVFPVPVYVPGAIKIVIFPVDLASI